MARTAAEAEKRILIDSYMFGLMLVKGLDEARSRGSKKVRASVGC